MKRAVDMALGTMLAILVTPVILALALALSLQFRVWPFFTQTRLGRHGQPFRIVKLRTLPPQAPAYADKYEIGEVHLPRLPRLLRQFHLDELPQLWLVPWGRMSLVGPRPEMAFLHERLDPNVAAARLSVRPGCTGLWQVSVHADRLIHEHPEYDLTYVANASLVLDTMILWHTARKLLGLPAQLDLYAEPAWALDAHSQQPAMAAADRDFLAA